jgi:hypothetical protein
LGGDELELAADVVVGDERRISLWLRRITRRARFAPSASRVMLDRRTSAPLPIDWPLNDSSWPSPPSASWVMAWIGTSTVRS